jgi:alpha-beta hydrolase superfamily lysophospholipase
VKSTRAAIGGVPALVRSGGSPELAAERGTVLYYHGFSGDKERCEPYLTALAEAGFLAVSLDAAGHGERRLADFDVIFNDERWDADFEATETDFLKLIDDTAAEVPAVLDDLVARGWARPDRMGVCGRSLGGNISYAAVLADRRLRAAVSVVGSPEWTLPRAHSPHHHPERFFPVAILSQNAGHDEYVPAGPVRDFHARLEPWYAREPGRIAYVEYPDAGHFLTPELNADSCRRLVAWFERWLPG